MGETFKPGVPSPYQMFYDEAKSAAELLGELLELHTKAGCMCGRGEYCEVCDSKSKFNLVLSDIRVIRDTLIGAAPAAEKPIDFGASVQVLRSDLELSRDAKPPIPAIIPQQSGDGHTGYLKMRADDLVTDVLRLVGECEMEKIRERLAEHIQVTLSSNEIVGMNMAHFILAVRAMGEVGYRWTAFPNLDGSDNCYGSTYFFDRTPESEKKSDEARAALKKDFFNPAFPPVPTNYANTCDLSPSKC